MAAKGRITIMIDAKLLGELDRMGKKLKRSRSEMVQSCIEEFVENARLGVEAFTNPVLADAMLKAFGNREVLRAMARAMGEELDEAKFAAVEGLFSRLNASGKSKGVK
jgi:hypothetical protein